MQPANTCSCYASHQGLHEVDPSSLHLYVPHGTHETCSGARCLMRPQLQSSWAKYCALGQWCAMATAQWRQYCINGSRASISCGGGTGGRGTWPESSPKVPAGQSLHSGVPALALYLPGKQSWHLIAPTTESVPGGHLSQLELPWLLAYVPAAHGWHFVMSAGTRVPPGTASPGCHSVTLPLLQIE